MDQYKRRQLATQDPETESAATAPTAPTAPADAPARRCPSCGRVLVDVMAEKNWWLCGCGAVLR